MSGSWTDSPTFVLGVLGFFVALPAALPHFRATACTRSSYLQSSQVLLKEIDEFLGFLSGVPYCRLTPGDRIALDILHDEYGSHVQEFNRLERMEHTAGIKQYFPYAFGWSECRHLWSSSTETYCQVKSLSMEYAVKERKHAHEARSRA